MAGFSYGLIRDMKKSVNQLICTELAVVMKDIYPKAKFHYLVLPWEDIDTVYQLSLENLPLLHEMHFLGSTVIQKFGVQQGMKEDCFQMGFHMKPSMHRLHLHCISTDFVSESLKYKEHWNSFVTDFFMPFESIVQELQEKGRIEKRPEQYVIDLLKTPLVCNQCNYHPKNFPDLKRHLANHLSSTGSGTEAIN
ncbi:aprataxin-like protein [Uranotaenia lowii]|uniref:aprataxin-like protein n=1 Tax=Uranotaenia lowii TaxID=190385 RepID=UPI002479FFC1|nr:aprataxin-like protein [Uranotaenia lowii]